MRFSILTLFPEFFAAPLGASLLGRAQGAGLLSFDYVNLRDHGEGNYRAVDDKPYGGGAGMLLTATTMERAMAAALGAPERLDQLEADVATFRKNPDAEAGTLPHVLFMSPQGRPLDAKGARRLSRYQHLVLVCGHYEGVDERAIDAFMHEELSIGDYVLTGGEPAALVTIDAISRFVPGVVGELASVAGDTFEADSPDMASGGLKYPMFTRPAVWRGRKVPDVLLSGNHAEIAKWRKSQSEERTRLRRPELFSRR